jgi:hypothetical protein
MVSDREIVEILKRRGVEIEEYDIVIQYEDTEDAYVVKIDGLVTIKKVIPARQ